MNEFTTISDADVIARLATEAGGHQLIDVDHTGRIKAFVLRNGESQRVEYVDLEQYRDIPDRATGRVTLRDAGSFTTYVQRHIDPRSTTIWADIASASITAVINDHDQHAEPVDGVAQGEDLPGWGDHRAKLELLASLDWKHWLAADGKYMTQDQFAEHLEDGAEAITSPSPAEMLEVAQTFHATSGVNFESSKRLSGDIEFAYSETTGARAGERGRLEVPQIFELALAPFDGGEVYPLAARFRYRLANGGLSLGYRLIRPDRVRQLAFDELIETIGTQLDLPVMAGTPRS